MVDQSKTYYLEEIFTEKEVALIWAALCTYDVGPKEANPKLYKELEQRRQDLIKFFE